MLSTVAFTRSVCYVKRIHYHEKRDHRNHALRLFFPEAGSGR